LKRSKGEQQNWYTVLIKCRMNRLLGLGILETIHYSKEGDPIESYKILTGKEN